MYTYSLAKILAATEEHLNVIAKASELLKKGGFEVNPIRVEGRLCYFQEEIRKLKCSEGIIDLPHVEKMPVRLDVKGVQTWKLRGSELKVGLLSLTLMSGTILFNIETEDVFVQTSPSHIRDKSDYPPTEWELVKGDPLPWQEGNRSLPLKTALTIEIHDYAHFIMYEGRTFVRKDLVML